VEKLHDFSVFTKDNLQTSLNVLVLNVVIILAVCVIEFSRKRKLNDFALYKNIVSIKISLLYVVIFSSFIFSVFFFTTNITLLDIGYPLQGESQWVSRSILKLPFFLASAALWVLYIKDAYYKVNGKFILNLARTNFIIVSMLILLLIGSRGIFVFLTFLFALFELRRYTASRNLIWFFVFIALMWLMYKGWPYIRVNLHLLPFSEVMSNSFLVMSPFKDMMSVEGGDLVKISQFKVLDQLLFHMLYVVQLVNDGISLGGDTFINLFPQSIPSFLDGLLMYRPRNDNWILGDYYGGGGGFLVIANAYWNGGVLVSMVFILFLTIMSIFIDRYPMRRKAGIVFYAVYILMFPVMAVQLGYGIQGLVRVLEVIMLVIMLDRLLPASLKKYLARS